MLCSVSPPKSTSISVFPCPQYYSTASSATPELDGRPGHQPEPKGRSTAALTSHSLVALACNRTVGGRQHCVPNITLPQQHTSTMMISTEVPACNMGRGAYDTTGVPKPPPPKPR
ncbi:hypothetical protein VTL71DRAFT_14591, partial [Oculimacula yallundae]